MWNIRIYHHDAIGQLVDGFRIQLLFFQETIYGMHRKLKRRITLGDGTRFDEWGSRACDHGNAG